MTALESFTRNNPEFVERRKRVYERVGVEEIKQKGVEEISAFPIIWNCLGFTLEEPSEMEYILSLVSHNQPGINFLGEFSDKICANQIELLVEGAMSLGEPTLRNLMPGQNPPTPKNAERDWEK